MENKKGFTIVELLVVIVLLVVIAGIFSLNFVLTLNRQKSEENENVISQIISAANAYVSANPLEIENLYNGYGYVDIPIGDLRNNGLLSEEIKDATTGEIIPDDNKVRVKLEGGDNLDIVYPIEKSTDAWKFILEDLNIDYDSGYDPKKNGDWCSIDDANKLKSNVYTGLITNPNVSDYSTWKSKMYLMNNKENSPDESRMYDKDYFDPNTINLRVTSCNVNPGNVGTYNITYKYIDVDLGVEKTANRVVHVNSSNEDVVAFSVVINKGNSIVRGTPEEDVPIMIREIYRNGAKDFDTTVGKLDKIGYEITNFKTQVVGNNFEARVSRVRSNSDGSIPEPQRVKYVVIPDTYTLTFNPEYGNVDPKSIIVTYMKPYGTLPTPTRVGYKFDGWFTDSKDGDKIESSTIMEKLYDHTLYAHWTPMTFTVAFDGNSGVVGVTSKAVTYDSTYGVLPTPSREGYNFTGWYTRAAGGELISPETKVSILSNQTLYAHWTPKIFTIFFDPAGGSVSTASKTVTYDSTYGTLPTAYRSGYYYFSAWNSSSGVVNSSTRVTITSNQTLTASYYYSPPAPTPPAPTYTPSRPTSTTKPSTGGSSSGSTTTTKVITETEQICGTECQMQANSREWWVVQNDSSLTAQQKKEKQNDLHQQNVQLSKQLSNEATYKGGSWYDSKTGKGLYNLKDDVKKTTVTTTKTVTCTGTGKNKKCK